MCFSVTTSDLLLLESGVRIRIIGEDFYDYSMGMGYDISCGFGLLRGVRRPIRHEWDSSHPIVSSVLSVAGYPASSS